MLNLVFKRTLVNHKMNLLPHELTLHKFIKTKDPSLILVYKQEIYEYIMNCILGGCNDDSYVIRNLWFQIHTWDNTFALRELAQATMSTLFEIRNSFLRKNIDQ